MYIGFWKDDLMQGYGKWIDSKTDVKEGLFEWNEYMEYSKSKITRFNPNVDKVAMKINFENYLTPYQVCEEKMRFEDGS